MSQLNPIFGRTSTLLTSDRLLSTVQRTQAELLDKQEAISTGLEVQKPSDAAPDASSILQLQNIIEEREQQELNLQFALNILNNTDQGLANALDITLEAKTIASSQIGIGSSAEIRQNQSHVIDGQIQGLLEVANRDVQGIALFGGRRSTADGPVFIERLGGIEYLGADEDLEADVGLDRPLAFNSNGKDAFGALSARIVGQIDLNPQATTSTALKDIKGATFNGFRPGTIVVTVNANAVSVDLNDANTLGDVITRVNDAINNIDPTAGALSIAPQGFSLTANAGHTIDINNLGTGKTADDLGLIISATSTTTAGTDIDPLLTQFTDLSALGVSVDLASGLKITQGTETVIADFSTATNIQDMINTIDQLNLGLRLEISDNGKSLNLFSDISGIDFSVGENSGGTTASDLGLRSFDVTTNLDDFQHGIGVSSVTGEDDFAIQLHDATTFNVNIDGLTTVGQVITAIQNAATSAGLTVGTPGTGGTDFNIGLAQDGNGLQLEDGTAGTSSFRVIQLGTSLAATDLGIYTSAATGNTINGDDLTTVRVESVFTHLIELRNSLVNDDSRGITFAGEDIEVDISNLARIRADVGVRGQRVEQQQQRSEELKIAEKTLLSELRDADLTEVITRFTQLQQQLQASLLIGSQNLQQSLLNFLR